MLTVFKDQKNNTKLKWHLFNSCHLIYMTNLMNNVWNKRWSL